MQRYARQERREGAARAPAAGSRERPRRSAEPMERAQRSKKTAALSPGSATLLFAAVLVTVWLVLCPLIMWAVGRAQLHFTAPWPLQDVARGEHFAEQVALYACLAISVLLAGGAMELQCAQVCAAANGQEVPHPRVPSRRTGRCRQAPREDQRPGGESAPASSQHEEDPQNSWVPEMTEFPRWDRESRARQQARIDLMRAAVRELRVSGDSRDASNGTDAEDAELAA